MSDSSTLKDQSLPKDILELTKSVKQEDPEKNKNDKEILELTELVSDEDIQTDTNTKLNSSVIGKEIIKLFNNNEFDKCVIFYNNFPERAKNNNCIHSKFYKRLHYHLKIVHQFDEENFLKKFKNKKILEDGKSFVIKSDDEKCKKIIIF